jgi:alpha-beta hydrolase superfamily lysophospholipase
MSVESTFDDQIWFGPRERPLFGWLNGPRDGRAHGGVILAPSVGQEAFAARHAMRALAESLARNGLVTLRFDYDGTGDSGGDFDDPDRGRAWVNSVGEGAELLRSMGLTSIAGVGMRLGATLLGVAAAELNIQFSSIVLWDPCESGRNYLRELTALEGLRRENFEVNQDGSVETSEFVFTSQTAGEIRALSLVTAGSAPLAKRTLVMTRDDRSISVKLQSRLADGNVEWQSTSEHGAMFDVEYYLAVLPEETIKRISEWLSEAPPPYSDFRRPDRTPSTVVAHEAGAYRVVERSVIVGPRKVFAIVSEPVGVARGPWIVLVNSAGDDHTGRARRWVELSRRWSALGLRCVRFDLSGYGETPQVDGRGGREVFDRSRIDDLHDVVQEVTPQDLSNCVLVGLCSAAHVAVEGGLAWHARGVCAINPPPALDFLHAAARVEKWGRAPHRTLSTGMKNLGMHHPWLAATLSQTLEKLPSSHFIDSLSALENKGTDLLVLASEDDLTPRPRTPFLRSIDIRRIGKKKSYEVQFVSGADHGLHSAEGRNRAMTILDAYILAHYASTAQLSANSDNEL